MRYAYRMPDCSNAGSRHGKKFLAVICSVMAAILAFSGFSAYLSVPVSAQEDGFKNPRIEMNTCATVYFGSYWQEDTDGNGTADQLDAKTPIRWRILEKKGNMAYVISDRILDCRKYHEKKLEVAWEQSDLRQWLNGYFYQNAFTEEEREQLQGQRVTEDGFSDQVSLPLVTDMSDAGKGFLGVYEYDQARIGKVTPFAREKKVYSDGDMGGWWWLRSDTKSDRAPEVDFGGHINKSGHSVNYGYYGVRPVLMLNLASGLVTPGDQIETSVKGVNWDLVSLGSYGGNPVLWRVLQASEDAVYLLADQILCKGQYHERDEEVTWAECSLRKWLNGEFLDAVFTEEEKEGILPYTYQNPDNLWYGTEGGEDTQDLISLLSIVEVSDKDYGFPTDLKCAAEGRSTVSLAGEEDYWWLRSPGEHGAYTALVYKNGQVFPDGLNVKLDDYGVRPVLHYSLSSGRTLKRAGVRAAGEVSGTAGGEDTLAATDRPSLYTVQPWNGLPEIQTGASAAMENAGKILYEDTNEEIFKASDPKNRHDKKKKGTGHTDLADIHPIRISVRNQGRVKKASGQRIVIKDGDGIRLVMINDSVYIKTRGKKKYVFSLKKYQKYLAGDGEWNKLLVIDKYGYKKKIQFQMI